MSWLKNIAKYSKSNKKMLDTVLSAASKAAPKVTRTKKSKKKGSTKKKGGGFGKFSKNLKGSLAVMPPQSLPYMPAVMPYAGKRKLPK